MDAAKNFAKGTLAATIDEVVTSLTVQTNEGLRFPAVPFNATIWDSTDYPDPADDPQVEIVRVTAKATDTFTITRGQEGTGNHPHDEGGKTYTIIAGLTAKVINDDIGDKIARIEDSGTVTQIGGGAAFIEINSPSSAITIGDVNSGGNNTTLLVDDANQVIRFVGQVVMLTIPDTDPAVEGALWKDGGVVKISAG